VQHADALRRLGDLTAARSYAERSVAAAGESHIRGQVHRLATLATILAGQGQADAAAGVAGQMLDRATGMKSCRIQDRIVAGAGCGDRGVRRGGGPGAGRSGGGRHRRADVNHGTLRYWPPDLSR
jgi:hypothetical protein